MAGELASLTPAGMAVGLAGAGVQSGLGIYGAIKGSQMAKQAEEERLAARQAIEDTQYADYNQAYYDELQRRANVGLPQEQMLAMQQQADRAAGVGLAATEDRRGGLMGIGSATAGLSNAYTQIGLADVAARQQNAQAVLQEMANRGAQTYGEQQQLNQYDLAIAQQRRAEGIAQQQAGLQNIAGAAGSIGTFLGRGKLEDIWGDTSGRQDVTSMELLDARVSTSPTETGIVNPLQYYSNTNQNVSGANTLQIPNFPQSTGLMNANRGISPAPLYQPATPRPAINEAPGLIGSVYGPY